MLSVVFPRNCCSAIVGAAGDGVRARLMSECKKNETAAAGEADRLLMIGALVELS
jgi:hypothetical protein